MKILSCIALICALIAPVNRSHAILGGATANPVLLITGAVLVASHTVLTVAFSTPCSYDLPPCNDSPTDRYRLNKTRWLLGINTPSAAAVLAGIILLKKDGTPTLEFSKDLSLEDARRLNLALDQRLVDAFNYRRNDFNLIAQEVSRELSKNPSAKAQDSKYLWRVMLDASDVTEDERNALSIVASALLTSG